MAITQRARLAEFSRDLEQLTIPEHLLALKLPKKHEPKGDDHMEALANARYKYAIENGLDSSVSEDEYLRQQEVYSELQEIARVEKNAQNVLDNLVQKPEMMVVDKVNKLRHRVQQSRKVTTFVRTIEQGLGQLLKMNPLERRSAQDSLAQSTLLEEMKELYALDEKLIEVYPEPITQQMKLEGAKAAHRFIDRGEDWTHETGLVKVLEKSDMASYRREAAHEGRMEYDNRTREAYTALAKTNGNKTAAAQLLGISRAKIRRLTGEQM
jgi:hypothetical protein